MTYSNLYFSNQSWCVSKSKIEDHPSHLKCYPVRALDWGAQFTDLILRRIQLGVGGLQLLLKTLTGVIVCEAFGFLFAICRYPAKLGVNKNVSG